MEFLVNVAEQQELFGDFLPGSYGGEAWRRWGDTAEWGEAAGRVGEYALTEWQEIRAEQADLEGRLVRLLTDGCAADSRAAMDVAEEHRRHIDRWYYSCPPAQHVRVVEFVCADPSFHARYEGLARGAAAFLRDAAVANASRNAGE